MDAAKLNLEFTQIKSPIAGRVSREAVTVGNLVTTDTTVLTNIVSVDPIYAYADVDERAVHRLPEARSARARSRTRAIRAGAASAWRVAGETGFPAQG